MNDIIAFQEKPLTATDIRAQVNLVQEVMRAVMKEGTHYGVIPGTPKPSLWKPGAEVLAATFRIAVSYKIEDLSTDDVVRYRVTAIGKHQTTDIVMGEGMGECSSNEEKYKWRKAINTAEFAAIPENRRRTKFGKQYNTDQVRTEAADLANTVLKMACKRAQVAMTLNVTAASDIFTQDIEDLPEELRPTDGEPAQKMPEYLPQDVFDAQKSGWEKAINSGKKSVDALIAWIEAKGTKLSESQLAIVKAWKPEPQEEKASAPAIDPDDLPFVD